MKKNHTNKGFSMVELIIVIAIMAILSAALAPALIKYIRKSQRSTDISNADTIYDAVQRVLSTNEDAEIAFTYHNTTKFNVSDENGNSYQLTVVLRGEREGKNMKWWHGNNESIPFRDAIIDEIGKYQPTVKYTKPNASNQSADSFIITYREADKSIEIWAADFDGSNRCLPVHRYYPAPEDD